MDIINNNNDRYLWGHAYQTYQSENKLKEAQIINVTYKNHLALSYDVVLLDNGIEVPGCRVALGSGGFNGGGDAISLEEGTPVLVSFKDGIMQDGYIIGTFNTPGIYDEYFIEGKLQEPGTLTEGVEHNQVIGHPNRITQIDSQFKAVSSKILNTDYDSPEYHNTPERISGSRGEPGSIEMRNVLGDVVQYTTGANVIYSDGNILQIAGGDREEKTTKLLRIAAMHEKRAILIEKRNGLEPKTYTKASDAGITPLFNNTESDNPFALTARYKANQERKLAKLYREAAKYQSQQAAAKTESAVAMQQNFGNEINRTPSGGLQVSESYKPSITRVPPASGNFGSRRKTNFPPIVVIHETAGSGTGAISWIRNPRAKVSYHAIVKRDGTVVNMCDPTKRAYAAGVSEFKGQKYGNSVNDFAYQISLESPQDGWFVKGKPAATSHSGYTDAQYLSLAYMIARTGIPDERITTHKGVDRSGTRIDPVSFKFGLFFGTLAKFERKKVISLGIADN